MLDRLAEDALRDRWLGVEVRHLAALAAIATEGSFRGAADSLGYVQSAVSQQLVQLERLLGARLIERSRGTSPVRLTAAGALLLEHVEQILTRFGQAHGDLGALTEGRAGPLRVGVFHSAAVSLVPRIATGFATRFPGVDIAATLNTAPRELTALLMAGEVDLTFCVLPQPHPELDTVALMEDQLVLLVRADSPLTGRDVSLRDLADLPLVSDEHCPAQHLLRDALAEQGITPRRVSASKFHSLLESAVATGAGAAVVPRLALTRHRRDIVAVNLPDVPAHTIALAWRRDRPRSLPAQAFTQLARDLCRGITRHRAAARRQSPPAPPAA